MREAQILHSESAAKFWFRDHTRLKPSFIVIGAMRSGTTSLYRYLCQHPWVASANYKELHFFDHQYFPEAVKWYARQFPSRFARMENKTANRFRMITGEASPSYLLHPLAPQRAAKHLPAAKLVAVLRNPVDRAFSHYQHGRRWGYEPLSFEEAIKQESSRIQPEREKLVSGEVNTSDPFMWFSYCARGCYMDRLEEWLQHYPKEKLLIIISEELYADPNSSMRRLTDFLGLPPMVTRAPDDFEKHNLNQYQGMNAATRKELLAFFRPHNQRLAKFLGRELPWDV
ncbi:MAG TPA: sulfotransferase [Chthoniobacterales bacterium]|nr:sulfotransferase [Chthoniobacterales bacterium]